MKIFKKSKCKLAAVVLLPLIGAHQTHASPIESVQIAIEQCDNHLVTIEKNGDVSAGSKKALVTAFRKGASIRVGWELDWNNDKHVDISHWTNAQFLSEFEGEIFAQIPSIQQQRARKGKSDIIFPEKSQEWYGLLRSDGVLKGRYSEKKEMTKSYNVRSMWCLSGL